MLLELYTVDSITQNETRRGILSWYSRFDVFAGLMSGHELLLSREWFTASERFYHNQCQNHPEDIAHRINSAIATHRLIAIDMASLFAKLPREVITVEDFMIRNEELSIRILSWKQHLDQLRIEAASAEEWTTLRGSQLTETGIDPYMPGGFHAGDLSTLNCMLMDWYAIDLLHKYQGALMLRRQLPSDLGNMALQLCRMFEAVDSWAEGPSGIALSMQAILGIATIFLPKDNVYISWCRRKLAKIEAMG